MDLQWLLTTLCIGRLSPGGGKVCGRTSLFDRSVGHAGLRLFPGFAQPFDRRVDPTLDGPHGNIEFVGGGRFEVVPGSGAQSIELRR